MSSSFDLLGAHEDDSIVYYTPQGDPRTLLSVRRYAAQLQASLTHILQQAPGAPVLVACAERPAILASCLAIWSLGGVVVLAPNRTYATLRSVIGESGTRALLLDEETLLQEVRSGQTLADVGSLLCPVLDARYFETGATAPLLAAVHVPAARSVASLYTSGTTGQHQRCDKTAQQLLGEAELLARTFGFGKHSVVGATVPAHHLYGLLFSVLVPLAAGAPFLSALSLPTEGPTGDPAVTDLVTVPVHIRSLLEDGRVKHLRGARSFSSGGILDQDLAERLAEATGNDVIDILGASESGGVGYRRANRDTPYQPLNGLSVKSNSEGRLCLRSPFLPDHGAEFHEMGDRIETLDDGRFLHLGRTDGVVKIGGKRIAVQELEAQTLRLPGITDVAVLVRPTVHLRRTELWLAVASRDTVWTKFSLREALAQWFDRVLLPRRYRVLPTLPRDSLGKLSNEKLLALFGTAAKDKEPVSLSAPRFVDDERGGRFEFDLSVSPNLPHFQGHFEQFPILPGIAQLTEIVLPAVRLVFPKIGVLESAIRIKFRRAVLPGSNLRLTLRQKPHSVASAGHNTVLTFELHHAPEEIPAARPAPVMAALGELRFKAMATSKPATAGAPNSAGLYE